MRHTLYYNLNKPENSDPVLIGDLNENMDTLDINLHNKQDELTPGVGIQITKSGTTTTITNTGVPGPVGPRGPTGVAVQSTEPTSEDVQVWIDTGDPSTVIDDTSISQQRVWSSSKVNYELSGKQAAGDYATNTALSQGLATKQNTLTWDTAPTQGSLNPVTSNGIYQVIGDVEALLEALR